MKITKDKLKKIIKEELQEVLRIQEIDRSDGPTDQEIQQLATNIAGRDSSENQILSLLQLSYTDPDSELLRNLPDIQMTDDEELGMLVFGGPYSEYAVKHLKNLAKNIAQHNSDFKMAIERFGLN